MKKILLTICVYLLFTTVVLGGDFDYKRNMELNREFNRNLENQRRIEEYKQQQERLKRNLKRNEPILKKAPIKDLPSEAEYATNIEKYTAEIERNPNDALAYTNRGDTYLASLRYDDAIADYNKAISIEPTKYCFIYYSRGRAYLGLEKMNEAKKDFKKACELGDTVGCFKFEELTKGGN
jgi:tetratricopeptide (TPR) repeat protein